MRVYYCAYIVYNAALNRFHNLLLSLNHHSSGDVSIGVEGVDSFDKQSQSSLAACGRLFAKVTQCLQQVVKVRLDFAFAQILQFSRGRDAKILQVFARTQEQNPMCTSYYFLRLSKCKSICK